VVVQDTVARVKVVTRMQRLPSLLPVEVFDEPVRAAPVLGGGPAGGPAGDPANRGPQTNRGPQANPGPQANSGSPPQSRPNPDHRSHHPAHHPNAGALHTLHDGTGGDDAELRSDTSDDATTDSSASSEDDAHRPPRTGASVDRVIDLDGDQGKASAKVRSQDGSSPSDSGTSSSGDSNDSSNDNNMGNDSDNIGNAKSKSKSKTKAKSKTKSKAKAPNNAAKDTENKSDAAAVPTTTTAAGTVTVRDRADHYVSICRLEWTRAGRFLYEETQRAHDRLVDVVTALAAMALAREPSTKRVHELEMALRDLHSHCAKLVLFSEQNHEAVRKATKKFDKRTGAKTASAVMGDLDATGALDGADPRALELRTRHLFAQYFARGNIVHATEKLRQRAPRTPHWRVFFVVGACVALAALLLYEAAANRADVVTDDDALVLTVTRISFGVTLLLLFFSVVLAMFGRHRIHHVLVMELDRRSSLHWAGFLEISSHIVLVHVVLLTLFVRSLVSQNRGNDVPVPPTLFVGAIPASIALLVALPVRLWHWRTRLFFWRTFGRIVSAPFSRVGFTDVFVADQLTSVTDFLLHAQFAICLASSDVASAASTSATTSATTSAATSATTSAPAEVSSCQLTSSAWIFALSMLPSWFRAMQCLHLFIRKGGVHPNLTNLLKYSTNIISALFALADYLARQASGTTGWTGWRVMWLLSNLVSASYKLWWDVVMDWHLSFSLRDPTKGDRHRRLPQILYRLVVPLDATLRFVWVLSLAQGLRGNEWWLTVTAYLEITRRSIWNLFRVERSHAVNCSNSVAARVRPLPFLNEKED
jgi:hypothetical protein